MANPIKGDSNADGVPGLKGDSGQFVSDGVQGFTHKAGKAGVIGVADVADAVGIKGVSEFQDGVQGFAKNANHSGVIGVNQAGVGVQGRSDLHDGVQGWTGAAGKAGVIGISTNTTPQAGPGVHGKSAAAGVFGENTASWHGVAGIGGPSGGEGVHGDSSTTWAGVGGTNTNNGPGVWGIGGPNGGEGVHGESRSGSPAVGGYSKGSGPAGFFDGNVVVTGDVILQGADYAEAFTTNDTNATPGTVVVLGDDGEVHPCEKQYDTRVAGIVSGACGVKPALVLDRHDNSAHIALMGKVWCHADASQASIRPGDLLTTSSTVGHCCRVTNTGQAFGSVIGKALTALESGRGLVRVLVSPR